MDWWGTNFKPQRSSSANVGADINIARKSKGKISVPPLIYAAYFSSACPRIDVLS